MSAMRRFNQVAVIPKEAPRAPTQEEWDALTPQQRAAVADALVCSESQEELDEADAMSEGEEHYDAKDEALRTLQRHFGDGGAQVSVGSARKVFYPGRKGFTPDIIAVVGTSPHKRDSWLVTQEGRGVDVIIEVFYKGNWRKDFIDNVGTYAELRVPEYFILDVLRKTLTAYRLVEGEAAYAPIKSRAARYRSEKLGLELGIRGGKLRFFGSAGILPTPTEWVIELQEIAEQEKARAEQEQARAEQEQARAEQEQARAEQEQARAEQACAQLTQAILTLAQIRGLVLSEADAARIRDTREVPLLTRWLSRVTSMSPADYAAGKLFLDS